jgi:hypothetical protein
MNLEASEVKSSKIKKSMWVKRHLRLVMILTKNIFWLLIPFYFFVAGYFYGNFYGVFKRHEVPSSKTQSIKVISIYDGDKIILDTE